MQNNKCKCGKGKRNGEKSCGIACSTFDKKISTCYLENCIGERVYVDIVNSDFMCKHHAEKWGNFCAGGWASFLASIGFKQ